MDTGWESIPQLTGVSHQVHVHLLKLLNYGQSRAFIPTISTIRQSHTLLLGTVDRPHQEIRNVVGDRLRKTGEFGCAVPDDRGIAVSVQGEDSKLANLLE